jgi:predicted O-methyltransferase YrrM
VQRYDFFLIYAKKVVSLQRIMDLKTVIYRVKSWLRHQLTAWNTGGEGVHSPYLFEWVRMVMSDAHAYNIWKEIEDVRERMLMDERVLQVVDYGSGEAMGRKGEKAMRRKGGEAMRRVRDIAKGSLARRKYAQMLFRLVNWLGHQLREESGGLCIVELGTSLGVTTAYLASVDKDDRVYTYEGSSAIAAVARQNWKVLGLNNIECLEGKISIEDLAKLDRVDVAFVDANHTREATLSYFDVLATKTHAKSVLVVDDIHYSREMEEAWREICRDSRVTSTIDLYQMGLVFFDTHYWKRNYRMRF